VYILQICLIVFLTLEEEVFKLVPGASYCNPCLSVAAILIPSIIYLAFCERRTSSCPMLGGGKKPIYLAIFCARMGMDRATAAYHMVLFLTVKVELP